MTTPSANEVDGVELQSLGRLGETVGLRSRLALFAQAVSSVTEFRKGGYIIACGRAANWQTYPLQDGMVLGRGAEVAVFASGPTVSRRHCRLERNGETWHLIDLASANGTFINGNKVASCDLNSGDLIQLGEGGAGYFVVM